MILVVILTRSTLLSVHGMLSQILILEAANSFAPAQVMMHRFLLEQCPGALEDAPRRRPAQEPEPPSGFRCEGLEPGPRRVSCASVSLCEPHTAYRPLHMSSEITSRSGSFTVVQFNMIF